MSDVSSNSMLNLVTFEERNLEWEVTNEDVASSSDEILVLRQPYHTINDGVILDWEEKLMDCLSSAPLWYRFLVHIYYKNR